MAGTDPAGILAWRWTVLALALFFCVWMVAIEPWGGPLGPFRFLTIWALFASAFAASRMLSLSLGRSDRRWDGTVGTVAVLNAMVVLLFWRLYFGDPSSVTRDGRLGVWWQEYYLHALGPALQWIDALFVHRSFRRPLRSAAFLVGVVALYAIWIELVVAPLNDSPAGTVRAGLPYPFLNDMVATERLLYYATNGALALGLLGLFCGIAALVRARI